MEAPLSASFGLVYQPVINIKHGPTAVVAFESLLRVSKNGQTHGPAEIVAAAEQDGSIVSIDRWVLNEVIKLAKSRAQLSVWINTSQLSIAQPEFLEDALLALTRSNTLGRVSFEVTETADVDARILASRLEVLRVRTLTVMLDDIRDGFSPRSLLLSDAVAGCKLSRDTTVELLNSERVRQEVQQLVKICRENGKKIVLEGIETIDELKLAEDLDIGLCQGYYFGYPSAPDELQQFKEMQATS